MAIAGVSVGSMLTVTTSYCSPMLKFTSRNAFEQPVFRHRAEHRAGVVDQRQNHGLLAKKRAQGHGLAGLIAKLQVQRNLVVQALIDADPAQLRGRYRGVLLGGCSHRQAEK